MKKPPNGRTLAAHQSAGPPHFSRYLRDLAEIQRQAEATPELSLREPLTELIRSIAGEIGRQKLLVAPEADAEEAGQPDIFIKDGSRLVGFVETKRPDEDLDKWLRTDKQAKRYVTSLPNWVLTDYFRFIFFREEAIISRASVEDPSALTAAFSAFLSYAPPSIKSPKRLAQELARRARLLRDGLLSLLHREPEDGPLRRVHSFYRRSLMDDLDEEGFADTFAQTIVYGLFLARLGNGSKEFTRQSAVGAIPQSVPFLRSAVRLLTEEELLPAPIIHLVDDLASLLNDTEMAPIRAEVAARGLERDLVVYFYEQFLEQYDAGERVKRGVYYTPPELVGYLIRATEALLRRDFDLKRGLAEPSVILLDPAVGTGTFLLGAAEVALATEASRGSASQRRLVREHLLKDFYGFELLPAAYAVAHLKLYSFFAQYGYRLSEKERIRIYLTNSLEMRGEGEDSQLVFLPMVKGIVDEARAAGRVKREVPVLVIVGNPPYDRTSHNENPHSNELLKDFYRVDGVPLGDKNTGPLCDDYLRFLRWSVCKLLEQEGSPGHGILAFVTNRAFIERTLHRAVRRFLLTKFDEIHVFDLHGDQREWFRDRTDEKVFKEVQAGIALTVFVKKPGGVKKQARVRYRETFGKRAEKLNACRVTEITSEGWRDLKPRAPLWLFVPYDTPSEYDTWPSVAELFPVNIIGVQTHRDQLVVACTEEELRERLTRFEDLSIPDSYWEAQNVKSNSDWDLSEARRVLRSEGPRHVMLWNYRGLDRRWIAFDERLIDRTRTQVSPNLMRRDDNLAIAFSPGSLTDGAYVLVSRRPMPAAVLSWRTFGQAYFAPLWLHHPVVDTWEPNIATNFLEKLSAAGIRTTPEGFLQYVYGVLNTPSFREGFAHGLRYDFPRIPIAREPTVFDEIRQLGAELVLLHLFEHPQLGSALPRMDGDDQSAIDKPTFGEADGAILVSPQLVARPVSAAVWNYQQGAYRVVRDFLQVREGRPLTAQEFDDFRRIVATVKLTIDRLPALDAWLSKATKNAFRAEELGLSSSTREGASEA
jgi:hypothetical protein